jgi:hypothetical protein
MEKELLAYCKAKYGGGIGGAEGGVLTTEEVLFVEAAWDLDD